MQASRVPSPRTSNRHSVAQTLVGHTTKRQNSRDELLLKATDQFSSASTKTRLDVEQFKEVFYLAISEVSAQTSQIVARSLSSCVDTPRQIALYFALEPIGIAAPFLIHGYQLGQLDLLQIIQKKGMAHARVIATRPDLGPSAVSRLKSFNDSKINDLLSSNQALIKPIRQAKIEAQFDAAMQTEPAPTAAEQPVAANVDHHQSQIERINETGEKLLRATQSNIVPAAETQSDSVTKEVVIEGSVELIPKIAEDDVDLVTAIEKVARSKQRQAMNVLLQKHLNLSSSTVDQLFEDRSGDALCVLLKSLDASSDAVMRILMLTFPSIGLSVQNAMRSIRLYDGLTVESCSNAVAKWPKRQGGFVGATPSHEGHYHDTGNSRDTQFGQRQVSPGHREVRDERHTA